jgi:hypothetical protein
MNDATYGWHWAGATLRDGRPRPPKGTTLRHEGKLVACPSEEDLRIGGGGYHDSVRAIDALAYAPGPWVARVKRGGESIPDGNPPNKFCSRERTNITEYVDATAVLVRLSRVWALRAIRVHAAGALRATGQPELIEHADRFARLPDDCDLNAARNAVWASSVVAWDVDGEAARAAALAAGDATGVANTALAAGNATGEAGAALAAGDETVVARASWAADKAAMAADRADGEDGAAEGEAMAAERSRQNEELEAELVKLLGDQEQKP